MAGLSCEEARMWGANAASCQAIQAELISKFNVEPLKELTLKDCLQLIGEADEAQVTAVFQHLQSHGLINLGVEAQLPDPDQAFEDEATASLRALVELKQTMVVKLYDILREADLQTVTEKAVREQLQADLGINAKEHKAFIKKYVNRFCMSGNPGLPAELEGSDAEQEEALEELSRPKQVVVVGAGAAGLAAASTLQRCGVRVVVLEAGEQAGGRYALPLGGAPPPCDIAPLPLLPPPLMPLLDPEGQAPQASAHQGASVPRRGAEVLRILAAQQGLTDEICQGMGRVSSGKGAAQKEQQGAPVGLVALQQVPLMDAATGTWLPPDLAQQAIALLQQLLGDVQAQASAPTANYVCLADALTQALAKRSAAAAAAAQASQVLLPPKTESTAAEDPARPGEDTVMAETQPAPATFEGDDQDAKPHETKAAPQANGVGVAGEIVDQGPTASGPQAVIAEANGHHVNGPQDAALAAPSVPVLDGQVARAVRWLIAALHNQQGVPAAHLPLSSAPSLRLYTQPHASEATDAAPAETAAAATAAGGGWLGLQRPSSATVAALPPASCQRLLSGLTTGLDIRYNTRVTEVVYDKPGLATAITDQGERIQGIAVLLAVPVSALQQGGIRLRPALPAWKADILNRITACATDGHTLLKFESALPPPPASCMVDASVVTPPAFGILPAASTAAGDAAAGHILQGPVLCETWSAPEGNLLLAADLDSQSGHGQAPTMLIPGLMKALHEGLPDLVPANVVSWTLQGGPAVASCDMQPQEVAAAAAPARQALFFAGEWCAPQPLTGCLAGAVLAGLREAARLVRLAQSSTTPGASLLVDDEQEVDEKAIKALIKERQKQLKQLKRHREEEAEEEEEDNKGAKKAKKGAKKGGRTTYAVSDDDDDDEASEEEEEGKGAKKGGKKRKGKRKGGGGSDSGARSDSGGEDVPRGKVKRTRGGSLNLNREGEREAEPFDPRLLEAQLRKREEARQDIKAAYKAVLQAQQGEAGPLLDMVVGCGGLDNRQQLLDVLAQADPAALDAVSAHQRMFTTLNVWLKELLEDRSAEHLVLGVLRLLGRLQGTAPMLKTAGLLDTVKHKCMESFVKDIKKSATDLWATWTKRFRTPAPSTSASTSTLPAGGVSKPTGPRAPAGPPLIPASLPPSKFFPPPQAPSSQPPSSLTPFLAASRQALSGTQAASGAAQASGGSGATASGGGTKGEVGKGGSGGTASGGVGKGEPGKAAGEVLQLLNPALAAQLKEEKEKLMQRQTLLEEAKARRAAQNGDGTGASSASSRLPTIKTFNEYREKKLQVREEQQTKLNKESKAAVPSAPKDNKHKGSRDKEKHAASGAAVSGTSGAAGPSSGAGGGVAGGKGTVDQQPQEGVTVLRDYVAKLLKPAHVEKRISSVQFREIRDKVVSKVCESIAPGVLDKHWIEGPKRKDKVQTLVDRYVEKPPK